MREERNTDHGFEVVCQVLDGREVSTRCPAIEEHIQFHEIKLYGDSRL